MPILPTTVSAKQSISAVPNVPPPPSSASNSVSGSVSHPTAPHTFGNVVPDAVFQTAMPVIPPRTGFAAEMVHTRAQSQGKVGGGWHQHTPSSSSSLAHPTPARMHTSTPSHSRSRSSNLHSRSQSQSNSQSHSRTPSSILSSSGGPGSTLSLSNGSMPFFSPLASPLPTPGTGPSWGTAGMATMFPPLFRPSGHSTSASGSGGWPGYRTEASSSGGGGAPMGSDHDGSGSNSVSSSSFRSSPNPVSDAEEMHTLASTTTTADKLSPPIALYQHQGTNQGTNQGTQGTQGINQPEARLTPSSTTATVPHHAWPKRQMSFPSALSLAARKASAPSLRAPETEDVPPVPPIPPLPHAPGLARIESGGAETPTPVPATIASPIPPITTNSTQSYRRTHSVSSSNPPTIPLGTRPRGISTSASRDSSLPSPRTFNLRSTSPPPVAVGVPSMGGSLGWDARNALMKADAAFPTVSATTTNAAASSGRIGSDLVGNEGMGLGDPVGLGLAFDSNPYSGVGEPAATESVETLDAHAAEVGRSTS